MSGIQVWVLALTTAIGAVVFVLFSLWKKLRAAHVRLHALDSGNAHIEHQIADLSRAASQLRAATQPAPVAAPGNCKAQHGEELFLWQRCGYKTDGVFVEIGAYDGIGLSNSLFFESIGWSGVLVEAHPGLAERCRLNRPNSKVIHAALGAVDGGYEDFSMVSGPNGVDTLSFVADSAAHRNRIAAEGGSISMVSVPRRTLAGVLDELGITGVDWISIDVEGAELLVLQGMALDRLRPGAIMIEDNSGGRDELVANAMAAAGYRKDLRVGCNDFYVPAAGSVSVPSMESQ